MISSLLYNTKAQPCDWIDLPEFLAGQDLFPKFYHKCKDSKEERAALGSLVTLPFIPKITQNIDPSLCFYGAVSFPQNRQDPLWKDFPPSLFFLPLYEIRQTANNTIIYTRSLPYLAPLKPSKSLTMPYLEDTRVDLPSQETWNLAVMALLQDIDNQKLEKAVLSRRSSFSIAPTVDPLSFVKKMVEEAPSTTTFALQPTPGSLFLGSSPETLYKRTKNALYTEAIAGTRKKTFSPNEDKMICKELQKSAKDLQEVHFVKQFLTDKLSPLCKKLSFAQKVGIVETEKLYHLHYPCQAILRSEVDDASILQALHPTPAVNGTPSHLATAAIHELEPHERGLYSGSIGWISSLDSSFTDAIRSGLIKDGFLHAFAGTGIVKGSKPDLEWEELNHKISHWETSCSMSALSH